jgi:hypothetical protein
LAVEPKIATAMLAITPRTMLCTNAQLVFMF